METFEECKNCFRPGKSDPERQANYRCPEKAAADWKEPDGEVITRWFGLPEITDDEPYLGPDPTKPWESNLNCCVGSWYRNEFVVSATRFFRPTSSDGVYSSNVFLDRCEDQLVLDAVAYYESEQNRHRAWYNERITNLLKRK